MASARVIITCIAFVPISLFQPLSATSDFLSPFLSPFNGDVCKVVECGKGTCKPFKNSTFWFECECDPGWKKSTFASNDVSAFKFLPCTVPNCSMNNSCSSKAFSTAPQKAREANESIFDACHWVDCGGGSCNKTSTFTYSCNCDAGYYNLLNATAMPCYKPCDLGMGCSDLGISMLNSSTSSTTSLNDDSNNKAARSILQGSSPWLAMAMLIMTMAEIQLQ